MGGERRKSDVLKVSVSNESDATANGPQEYCWKRAVSVFYMPRSRNNAFVVMV